MPKIRQVITISTHKGYIGTDEKPESMVWLDQGGKGREGGWGGEEGGELWFPIAP